MRLVENTKDEVKYLTNVGLEIKFAHSRYLLLDSMGSEFRNQERVEFWNCSPDSNGIDRIVQFVAEPSDRIVGKEDKLTFAEPNTDLHRAFLGVLRDGAPPEPFLDLLVETYPHLGELVDKYLTVKEPK